ncbi:MAG: class I SAM-dependent methyltransferase [Acidobacteria bacterium]|nr:class I SAM-dependent methyltransferase [Acidobacteriota bacterium]
MESVTVEVIAEAWAKERWHGKDSSLEKIRAYLLADLGASEVEFWQCQQCALEFALPMRSWSANHYPVEEHSLGFDHLTVLNELAVLPPLRILDIGCADGQFLARASALGHDLTGIDFAAEDVETARLNGLNAYVAEVGQLGRMFEGASRFKLITLFQIIEHLDEPDKIFSQINEIADHDARLIIGCPSDRRYTRRLTHPQRINRSDFWDYPPQHTLRWTPKALEAFLRRHGWEIETIAYEPLTLIGAAAHLACLEQSTANGTTNGWRRRLNTLGWLVKVSGSKFFGRATGMRLLIKARRL